MNWEKPEPRKIIGYAVNLPGFGEWEWFVNPSLDHRGKWVVSEVTTGLCVGESVARTRMQAAEKALRFLTSKGLPTVRKVYRKGLRTARMPKRAA